MITKRSKINISGNTKGLANNPFNNIDTTVLPVAENCKTVELALETKNTPKNKLGRVNVRLEKKSRGGKLVTVIYDFQLPSKIKLWTLLKQFQAQLSTGGTVKDGRIELQGDHTMTVLFKLKTFGFRPVCSGA